MKILAIGDFHGKLSQKLKKKISKYDFDIILSNGDFCGSKRLSEIGFKYYYAKSEKERKKVPKRIKQEEKYLEKKMVVDGIKVLESFKKLGKLFYAVHGNWDPNPEHWDLVEDTYVYPSKLKKFHKVFGKGFEIIDFKVRDMGDFVVVGGASSSHPGKIDKESLDRYMKKWGKEKPEEVRRDIHARKRIYKSREKKFILAFKRAKKMKKPIVFLTHNSPYGTKLDLIRDKKAHKLARGVHYGSYLERLMILRFKPDLVICGHVHENFGKDKLGKSVIVNVGSAFEGNFVIVDFDKRKKKFNLKFVK